MTQLPTEPGWPLPPTAPPVDTAEFQDAIRYVEKQGINRQGYVGTQLGCFWGLLAFGLLILGVLRNWYLGAVQAGDPQLIQTFPIQPTFQLSALIVLGLCAIIGVCFYLTAKHTRDNERYEIRDRLADSSIADDLVNRRLDFTRIYKRVKGPACLWWLGPHLKAKTQTEKKLSILVENLHIYLGYRPASFLADQNRWRAWDAAIWIALVVLIAVWALVGWGSVDYLELAVCGYISAGFIKSVPNNQLEAVSCQELARYLRAELGFSPEE